MAIKDGRVQEQHSRRTATADVEEDAVARGVRQYAQLLESADPKAIAIYMALWKASHAQALANTRAIDALNLPVTVSGTRLTVLRTLYFAPNRRMPLSELSRETELSPAMVTHLIQGLERGGLIERIGSPDDRRVTIARLTDAGAEAFHTVLPAISKRMTDACIGLTEEQKDMLLHLLEHFY